MVGVAQGYRSSFNAPFYHDITGRAEMFGAWKVTPHPTIFHHNAT